MATPISTINPFITKSQFTTQRSSNAALNLKQSHTHARLNLNLKFASKLSTIDIRQTNRVTKTLNQNINL